MENLAQVFKALSDPIRLRIIHLLLQKKSFCVCEIVSALELNQSTVSRHLAYLKNSGLVESWREGTWMHYSLKAHALQLININGLNEAFKRQETIQQDTSRLKACNLSSCP